MSDRSEKKEGEEAKFEARDRLERESIESRHSDVAERYEELKESDLLRGTNRAERFLASRGR